MVMLAPSQFSVGTFASVDAGLSLVLPRDRYEKLTLIAGVGNEKTAIFLANDYLFHAMECSTAENWKGLIVPGVSIEVDISSVTGLDGYQPRPGMLIREGQALNIGAHRNDSHSILRTVSIPLIQDLQACHEQEKAGFTRWQIVLWEGEEKQVLHSVDIGQAAQG